MINHYKDEFWMYEAILQAKQAAFRGEVPIGAVLIMNNILIGKGFNNSINYNDPTAHAEIIALRQGGVKIGNYRLLNSSMYVTIEPCIMCAGAMIHARISRLVFGARAKKTGAIGSILDIFNHPKINHRINVTEGILEKMCSITLTNFFRNQRLALNFVIS